SRYACVNELAADVERWLGEHDRRIEVSPADRVWQWLRTETDDLRLGALVGYLGAFVVFLHRRPDGWPVLADGPAARLVERVAAAVADTVPELSTAAPGPVDADLPGALRAVAEMVHDLGAAAAFGYLLDRYLDAHARRLHVTPAPVARLLVALAVGEGRSVLDPACGTGNLLVAAHDAGASELSGQDVATSATQVAGAQLLLRRPAAEIQAGDALRADAFAGRRFAAVVCDPPTVERGWGYDELAGDARWEHGLPPRGEPDLAWAQHCLAHLEPGGTAAVLMTPGAAGRRAGRRIRSSLLRSGVLRAVIALPADAGPPSDVWLLRRPRPDEALPGEVLLVRASDLDTVGQVWADFGADPSRADTGSSRSVRILDLLDDDVDVTPGRHVPLGEPAADRDYSDALAGFRSMIDAVAGAAPALSTLPSRRSPTMTTVGELAKAGLVVISSAPMRMSLDAGDVPVLTAKDVAAGRDPSGRTVDRPGLVPLEPGDVVAPALGGKDTVVRVVADHGAVLGPRLLAFRAEPRKLDPQFLAGHVRFASASGATRTGSTTSRNDARRIPVPLLPIDEQRRHGAAFRDLAAFQVALRRCADTGDALFRLGLAGLADGRWAPTP
ncbi:MAG: N-6 DNA methylase, partial [Pseudonocardia sp.]|nr:N-6 DNA methylase [Pseudonocardia sp.]